MFIYTRKESVPSKVEGEDAQIVEYKDSFNINCVTRTRAMPNGGLLVLLNDFHEETIDIPISNKKGDVYKYEKRRQVMYSEIYLEPDDANRFCELTII